MNIAILGAGHGGIAMAADLTMGGHYVHLAAVPEHARNLLVVQAMHGIHLDGYTSRPADPHSSGGFSLGFVAIPRTGTDVAAAIDEAEIIMVVVPANAQDPYIDLLVQHAKPGQIIVFNPVKFATLVFRQKWLAAGRNPDDVLVCGTESLLYAAKLRGGDHVWIKAVKRTLPFAADPARRTGEALAILQPIFEQLSAAANVLEISISDPGIVIHSVTTVLNTSRIEQMGPYRTGHYDITPGVGRVVEAIDAERSALAEALGLKVNSIFDTCFSWYGAEGDTLYERMLKIKAHAPQMAPDGLGHRYIAEEVPFGLVPLAALARQLSIPVPGIESLITLTGMATGIDYWEQGRTLQRLGLQNLSAAEMLSHVN